MVDSQGTQVKCALCHSILESGTALGPFTVSGTEKHVHLSCALFSSEVHLNPALLHDRIARKHETVIRRLLYAPLKDEKLASDLLRALPSALTNFEAILSRASSMDNGKCSRCRKVGATIACRFRDCPVNYHLNCVGNKTVNNEPIFCVPMAQIDPNELNLRPTRLMICSNHADVIPEWTYFVDDILRDEKVRLENTNCIDVSKLSPIYQMLFSQAARIVLFKPTSKTFDASSQMFSVETLAGDTRNFTPEELSVYEFGVHEEEIVEDKPSISSSSIALNREKRSVTEKPVATAAVMAATSSLGPRTRAMLSSEAADDNENMASLSSAESSNDSSVESKAASKGNTKSKQDVGKLKPKETEIKPAATRKGATRSIVVTSNPSNEDMEAAAQPDARRPMKSTPRTLSVPTKEKEKVRTAIDEELVKNSRRDDLAEKEKIIAKEVKRVAAKEGNAEENNEKVAREREEGKKNPPPPINSSSINISNMSSSASSLIQTKTSSAAASSSSVSAPPRVAEWQTTTLPTTTAPGWGYVEESHPNSVKYRFYGNDSDIVEVTAHQIYGKSNCIKDLLAIGDIEWTCAVQSDAELAKLGSFEGLLQSSDVIENVSMYRMDPDFRPDMTKLISKCPKDATLLAFPEHCPFEVLLLFRKKLSFIHFIRSRGLIDVISQTSDLSKESHYVVTILKGFFHPLQNIHYASSFSEEGATVVSTPSSSSSPPIRSATLNASKSPPVHVTQEEQQRASTIIKVAKMPTSSLNAIPREKSPIDVVPQKGDVNSFFDSVLLDATKGVPREKKNEGWGDVLCLPTWENGNIISAPSTNKATEISVSGSSGLKREASLKVLNGSGTASNGGTTAPVMIRLPTNPATSDYPRAPLIPSRTVKRLREDDALSEPRCKSESPRPKSQNRRPKDQVACRNGRRCTINPCPYNHMAECRNGSICTILHCRFGH